MTVPTITPLTDIPSITDPFNFDARADNFLTVQLPQLVAEINAAGGAMEQAVVDAQDAASVAINGSSASSILLGTGNKTFAVLAGHSWSVGTWLVIASRANPGTHWFVGQVTAYSGTSLTIAVHSFGGSGSRNDWDISLTAKPAEIPLVTTSANGLMSATDKSKLNGITAGAQPNAVSSVAGKTGAVTLAKNDVGLASVDNTSDANKPVSTAQLAALNAKLADNGDTYTNGYTTAPVALAFASSITPAIADGHIRTLTNSGAFTLNAPSGTATAYTIAIIVTNASSGAGAVTASGFTKVHGTFATTANAKQLLVIEVYGAHKTLSIRSDT